MDRRRHVFRLRDTVQEIRDYLEVDSLAYLSLAGMLSCVHSPNGDFCNACFSGDYPIPIDPSFQKDVFERRQLRFFDAQGDLAKVRENGHEGD